MTTLEFILYSRYVIRVIFHCRYCACTLKVRFRYSVWRGASDALRQTRSVGRNRTFSLQRQYLCVCCMENINGGIESQDKMTIEYA